MARNSAGTYTLPTGNPVVTHTTIASSTQNTTLTDIASELTDSLSRSGKGAMSAPLQLASGSVSAPGLSFSSDPDCGLYRIGANDIAIAVGGTKVAELTSAAVGLTVTGGTAGIVVTANSGNNHGVASTGKGTGAGLQGTGGDGNGAGVFATGTGTGVGADLTPGASATDAINSHGNIHMSGTAVTVSSSAAGNGGSRSLTPNNIVSAWVQATVNGAGNAITVNNGYNVASMSITGTNTVTLNFGQAMADGSYYVNGSLHNFAASASFDTSTQSANQVIFKFRDNANALITLTSMTFRVLVVGLTA